MLSIIFVLVLLHGSWAVLVNQGSYENTILKYYNQHDDNVNIAGALTRCAQRGGQLVMPKNKNLNAAVDGLLRGDHSWIGVGDFGVEGAYEFIDGSRMQWVAWGNGEPNNHEGNEDCVEIRGDGYWNDYHCERSLGYVCQFDNSRTLSLESSHLRMYKGLNRTTHVKATSTCEQLGWRLAEVTNDQSFQALSEKLPELLTTPSWINKVADSELSSGIKSCRSAFQGKIDNNDCEEKKTFVCESVEPHHVTVSKEEPVASKSSDLEISCSAKGFPTPDVTWFRNGMKVKDQIRTKGQAIMKLSRVSSSDAGLYICQAINVIDDEEYKMEGYSVVEVSSEEE